MGMASQYFIIGYIISDKSIAISFWARIHILILTIPPREGLLSGIIFHITYWGSWGKVWHLRSSTPFRLYIMLYRLCLSIVFFNFSDELLSVMPLVLIFTQYIGCSGFYVPFDRWLICHVHIYFSLPQWLSLFRDITF